MYFTKRELWKLWRVTKEFSFDTYDRSSALIGKWYHMPQQERRKFDIRKRNNQHVKFALSIPFEDIPLHLTDPQEGGSRYQLHGSVVEQVVFRWRLDIGK